MIYWFRVMYNYSAISIGLQNEEQKQIGWFEDFVG